MGNNIIVHLYFFPTYPTLTRLYHTHHTFIQTFKPLSRVGLKSFFPIHFLLKFHFRISLFNILSLSLSLSSIWLCASASASATVQEQKTKAEAECGQIKSYKICFIFGFLPQYKDRRSNVFGVTVGVLGFTTSSLRTFSKSKSLLSNPKQNLSFSFSIFFFNYNKKHSILTKNC